MVGRPDHRQRQEGRKVRGFRRQVDQRPWVHRVGRWADARAKHQGRQKVGRLRQEGRRERGRNRRTGRLAGRVGLRRRRERLVQETKMVRRQEHQRVAVPCQDLDHLREGRLAVERLREGRP
jgi:hypothetical protein